MIDALLWMLIGHAVADYPLQGDWLSKAKNPLLSLVPGETIWPMALLCHAGIHAGAVQLATGSWPLAAAEFVAHAAIDFSKCEGRLTYNQDQAMHIACKLAWFALLLLFAVTPAHARDTGHWSEVEQDPAVSEWYKNLMQPDVPMASCCGEADAYWCDDYYASTVGGTAHAYCKITDDRQDAPRNRPHIDIGTEFEIPPNKLKWDKSNPTGHGVLFLSRAGYVYCYVQPGGV